MMRPWPDPDDLQLPVADGVQVRRFRDDELEHLPGWILSWYPTVTVGAESVFTDVEWLRAHASTEEHPQRDVYPLCLEIDGVCVGMVSFQRQDAAQTLHARLGALDPAHRMGLLGYLGFLAFDALAEAIGAEIMLCWVTVATRGQQRFAARRGFRLCGIVPGFDRDAREDGSSRRVAEALFAKLRVGGDEVEQPTADQLEPATQALWDLLHS